MNRKPSVWVLAAAFSAWAWASALAQQPLPADAAILFVNPDRVLANSNAGRALTVQIEQARSELIQRAQTISTAFEEEERALTELRETLPRAEFSVRVEDFDRRVRAARAQQDIDANAFSREAEAMQRAFFAQLNGIYADLMAETGASAVVDLRTVLFHRPDAEVTFHVIERLNALTTSSPLDGQ